MRTTPRRWIPSPWEFWIALVMSVAVITVGWWLLASVTGGRRTSELVLSAIGALSVVALVLEILGRQEAEDIVRPAPTDRRQYCIDLDRDAVILGNGSTAYVLNYHSLRGARVGDEFHAVVDAGSDGRELFDVVCIGQDDQAYPIVSPVL